MLYSLVTEKASLNKITTCSMWCISVAQVNRRDISNVDSNVLYIYDVRI
jgi:hypothetical protein